MIIRPTYHPYAIAEGWTDEAMKEKALELLNEELDNLPFEETDRIISELLVSQFEGRTPLCDAITDRIKAEVGASDLAGFGHWHNLGISLKVDVRLMKW
jgi:hypothetical protein